MCCPADRFAAAKADGGSGAKLRLRAILNAIVWKFRAGVAWRDVSERYGPWATLHNRFRRWAANGTLDRMLRAGQARPESAGDIDWLVPVDSTILRAHRHAAAAQIRGCSRLHRTAPTVG
ncbi:transposase [[Kitasatospora] papulosa]|uniref:transposase n=1 Tax=[Kitasatospora] papulosa TaxID=1464011 RepID=UPI0036C0E1EA